MLSPTRVYVALGSNLGDRQANVREAIRRLAALAAGEVRASSIHLTAPEEMVDEAGEFANAVAGFDTTLDARELLAALQAIEVAMGRPATHAHHVSRVIDLDIISFGNKIINEPDLQIPHPGAHRRIFVLGPLAEIAGQLVLAGQSDPVNRLLQQLDAGE